MIPVKQSEIKAYLQPFRTDCIHIFPHQIPPGLCVGCLILRIFAVKQTESVVVLGCQNHIFHSGFLCHARPFFRIEISGVELLKIFLILFFGHFLRAADPFAAGGNGIQTPMDKHTESGIPVPFHPFVILFSVKLIHNLSFPACPLTPACPSECSRQTGKHRSYVIFLSSGYILSDSTDDCYIQLFFCHTFSAYLS